MLYPLSYEGCAAKRSATSGLIGDRNTAVG